MASKVKETTFGARDTLRITSSMDVVGLKDVEDGTEIEYCGHVVQEIVNERTGEVFESTLVKAADGKILKRPVVPNRVEEACRGKQSLLIRFQGRYEGLRS